ncbi:MAG: hypothetical protein IJF16_11175 [Clostridia bacterium]|nr:hypothetical protein [Clostridia bacterium]
MRDMEQLKKMLEKELGEYTQKGKISAGDLDAIHKLTDTVKNIDKIEMIERGGDDDYSEHSERRRRDSMGRYARAGSYDDGGSYEGGGSYRGGYSRHGDPKEQMMNMLEEMRMETRGHERQKFDKMVELLREM